MNGILLLARLLLAVVFGLAGMAKLLDRAGSRRSMGEFGVPATLAGPLAIALPIAELGTAVALVTGAGAWWGGAAAVALLAVFTAAILVNLARGRTPDCQCFGRIHSEPVGWSTVARNGVLIAVAAFVVSQGNGAAGPGLVAWLGALERTDAILLALAVSLAIVATGLLVAVVQLLAQNGRLMLRVEAIEERLGGRASLEKPAEAGLAIDTDAPSFTARDLDGRSVTLRSLSAADTPLLLVFSDPGCSACDQLMPDVARWQQEHHSRLRIVVVSGGTAEANRAKATGFGLCDVVVQAGREIAEAYQVTMTPSAVLVKGGVVASRAAVGGDAIRALVFANTLPPPVAVGNAVPGIELPDLDGAVVDLGSLGGRATALLFWDPGCGFCQSMLADLRSWERTRSRHAPELLIVSMGTEAALRDQRLRSRVLMDPHFGLARVFGATGTPSAVLIDDEGRVASEVGDGAPAVFELLARQPLVGSAP